MISITFDSHNSTETFDCPKCNGENSYSSEKYVDKAESEESWDIEDEIECKHCGEIIELELSSDFPEDPSWMVDEEEDLDDYMDWRSEHDD